MPHIEPLILRIAREQHGVMARWQLVAAGVPVSLINDRIKRRRWRPLVRGVYSLPGLEGPRADVVAAVLGAGPHAVASYETAGHVQEIIGDPPPAIHVSTSHGHPTPRPRVVHHRVRLASDERTVCDGVPITVPARTILDLAHRLSGRALEQAVARAARSHQVTTDQITRLLERYPGRPGIAGLRDLLGLDTAPALTRSEAEDRFLAIVRSAQLPEPAVNFRLHGYEIDFFWRHHALAVEIDGLAYHTSREAQMRDRQRDTTLAAAGIRVLRFTWKDVTRSRDATLGKVALALGRGLDPAR